MTTRTRALTGRELSTMSLADLDAYTRRDWPEGVVECPRCAGAGEMTLHFANAMPVTERCGTCLGTGYVSCRECCNTGYIEFIGPDGDHDALGYCNCACGTDARYRDAVAETDRIRQAEYARIDAEKEAHEATRPRPFSDLNAIPF